MAGCGRFTDAEASLLIQSDRLFILSGEKHDDSATLADFAVEPLEH